MSKWTFVQNVITGKRITIPAPVRELLKIEVGDLLRVTIEKIDAMEADEHV